MQGHTHGGEVLGRAGETAAHAQVAALAAGVATAAAGDCVLKATRHFKVEDVCARLENKAQAGRAGCGKRAHCGRYESAQGWPPL